MLYEALLTIEYNKSFGGLNKYTLEQPDKKIKLWCNQNLDIIVINDSNVTIDDLQPYFGEITVQNEFPNGIIVKLEECASRPIDNVLAKLDIIELPPTIYSGNKEILQLLFPSNLGEILIKEIENIPEVENIQLTSLSPFKMPKNKHPIYLPISDLLNKLTEKQTQVLLTAFQEGYYELPRQVKTEALGEKLAIGRRTFEEHLRKAEKKIIESIAPIFLFNK